MMSDDDYWNESKQKGFSFDDNDSAPPSAGTVPKHPVLVPPTVSTVKPLKQTSVTRSESVDTDRIRCVPLVSDITVASSLLHFRPKVHLTAGHTTPQETVKNMLLGLDFCLEYHRAKDEKIALLDAAIESIDGNAITAVVSFMEKTLKPDIFISEICKKPIAVNHYLCYIEENKEYEKLNNILPYLPVSKAEDGIFFKYKDALKSDNSKQKIEKLELCQKHYFLTYGSSFLTGLISEYISLLKRQVKIEFEAIQQAKDGNALLKMYPKEERLFDKTVISTLFFAFVYYYNSPEENCASPKAIRKAHQLTEKQYTFTVVFALAKLKKWSEINVLFQNTKSWLGGLRAKCCIGFHNVADIVAKAGADKAFVTGYIKLVDDYELKLRLAKKYKYHDLVLEILTAARDRQGLLMYKDELKPQCAESKDVDKLLLSPIKWKS